MDLTGVGESLLGLRVVLDSRCLDPTYFAMPTLELNHGHS
jgi:hypothetical protein